MLKTGCVKECPGCHHRQFGEGESLKKKEEWLKSILPWHEAFLPVRSLSGEERWGYRKKVCLNTEYKNGIWKFGMKVKDDIVDISTCPVHSLSVQKTLKYLPFVLPPVTDFNLAYYVQYGAQLVLIIKSKEKVKTDWITSEVEDSLQSFGIESLWIHLNPAAGKRLFEKTPLYQVFGKKVSYSENGVAYGIGAFQQLINNLYEDSLKETELFFNLKDPDIIVDLYCGIGQSLKRWSVKNKCLGIELNGFAFNLAGMNAPDALVLRGKCSERIPQINEWIKTNNLNEKFYLYANPPRTGFEPEITDWICKVKPSKIAYLSCSAGTLRKNLEQLTANGYAIKKIIPFDFFPHTHHVETLTLIDI